MDQNGTLTDSAIIIEMQMELENVQSVIKFTKRYIFSTFSSIRKIFLVRKLFFLPSSNPFWKMQLYRCFK